MKKFQKSKINRRIFKSLRKVSFVLTILFLTISFGKIQGTNSFFIDTASSTGNTTTAGYWIPELTMSVEAPDADGWYRTAPCVTLSANINSETDGITIYYEFSNDGNPISGGTAYSGACVPIPDGDPTHFQAQAYNNENHDWLSNIVSEDFKIHSGAEKGDVVINELMWMGSKENSNDEWIELRNMTGRDIDLSNWKILNGGSGSGHIEIPHGYSIKPHGYFLITKKKWNETRIKLSEDLDSDEGRTNVSGMNLANGGEKLTLEDKDHNTINIAWKSGSAWPAGWHGVLLHMSMERNNSPGDGTQSGSWHTCLDEHCNDTDYWRHEGWNFGTPGKVNLSANDPTAEDFDPAALEQKIMDEEDNSPDEEEPAAEENNLPADIPSGDNITERSSDIVTGENPPADGATVEITIDNTPAVIDEAVTDKPVEDPKPDIIKTEIKEPEAKPEEPKKEEIKPAEPPKEEVKKTEEQSSE